MAEPTVPDDNLYMLLQAGALGVHQMCRRCGALIAMAPPDLPDGTVTPQMAHTAFHDQIDEAIQRGISG